MKRPRLADAAGFLGLLGLGLLSYGWVWYPPLAWPLAVANLAFVAAGLAAWLIRRLSGRR